MLCSTRSRNLSIFQVMKSGTVTKPSCKIWWDAQGAARLFFCTSSEARWASWRSGCNSPQTNTPPLLTLQIRTGTIWHYLGFSSLISLPLLALIQYFSGVSLFLRSGLQNGNVNCVSSGSSDVSDSYINFFCTLLSAIAAYVCLFDFGSTGTDIRFGIYLLMKTLPQICDFVQTTLLS